MGVRELVGVSYNKLNTMKLIVRVLVLNYICVENFVDVSAQ